jgi:hypothetical protein
VPIRTGLGAARRDVALRITNAQRRCVDRGVTVRNSLSQPSVNGRTILALLGAPLAAAVVVSAMALSSAPPTPHQIAPEPAMFFVASLAVAAIFEALVLLPMWYLLRGATLGARTALWLFGVAAWFAAAVLLGYLLGHGGGVALSFGTTFLPPGIVVAAVFATLMPARRDGMEGLPS